MSANKVFFREIYLNKISPFIDKKIIKVITGQRRVGKSFIMLQLIEKIKQLNENSNIIFIDKENIDFDFIKNYNDEKTNTFCFSNIAKHFRHTFTGSH